MEGNIISSPVALVEFAADDQMPQLQEDYYAPDSDGSFSKSRLVLNEEENMQFEGQKRRVSRLSAGTNNQHYDPIDVATVITTNGSGNIQIMGDNELESSDDDPIEIATGNGSVVPDGLGRDENSYPNRHCHSPMRDTTRNLGIVCLISTKCFVYLSGGSLANSLAIMTDAAHLLSDFASFLISIFALWVAKRPATTRMSFGYYRAEVLGAVISVLIIWIVTGILCYLAVLRIINDEYKIEPNIMLITSGIGVVINIILIIILQAGGGHLHSHGGGGGHQHLVEEDAEGGKNSKHDKKNINVRAAFIHVIGDLIQSIGVLIAAGIIKANSDWKIADPICTFLFSILVLITTLTVLRDALNVLMEGVPRHINYPTLKNDLDTLPGVKFAHSLHVWSLTTSKAAIAVHLAKAEDADSEEVLQEASKMIQKKYGIHFMTIQVEKYQHEAMTNCARCSEL
nr:proton-coupled zinc antiporter SLC30A2-like [Lytechinus pictus]